MQIPIFLAPRHWPASLFTVTCLATLASLALLRWGPLPTAEVAGLTPVAMSATAGTATLPAGTAATASAMPPTARPAMRSVPESEWQQQRAEALFIERLNAEMQPLTPGVTPDQYVGAADEGNADLAASQGDDSSIDSEAQED